MNETINKNQLKEEQFAGHKKEGEWFLRKAEDNFRNKVIPYPSFYRNTPFNLFNSSLERTYSFIRLAGQR